MLRGKWYHILARRVMPSWKQKFVTYLFAEEVKLIVGKWLYHTTSVRKILTHVSFSLPKNFAYIVDCPTCVATITIINSFQIMYLLQCKTQIRCIIFRPSRESSKYSKLSLFCHHRRLVVYLNLVRQFWQLLKMAPKTRELTLDEKLEIDMLMIANSNNRKLRYSAISETVFKIGIFRSTIKRVKNKNRSPTVCNSTTESFKHKTQSHYL